MSAPGEQPLDRFSRAIGRLMGSPRPLVVMLMVIGAGLVALAVTPREEEPQIVVPVAAVRVTAPGLSAAQGERQVTTPLEQLLYRIDGIEHVYCACAAGRSVVTVRFFVGEVVPAGDPGSRSFVAKLRLGEELKLYPGKFARLHLVTGKVARIYVPARALTELGQLELATVISAQGPGRRFVRSGMRTAYGRVEILSGLTRRERVLLARQ